MNFLARENLILEKEGVVPSHKDLKWRHIIPQKAKLYTTGRENE